MISRFSKMILEYIIRNNAIENTENEKKYYQYGIEIMVSSLLNIILILFIGILTKSVFESIIFLVCFMFIRQFTGGFHANTYFKCNLILCISFITVLIFYFTTAKYLSTYFSILITFVCVSVFLVNCPMEHINKPIPSNRKKIHKIMAALLAIVYGTIGTILIAFSNKYGALVIYTLSLVTVLVIAAIKLERGDKYEVTKKGK